MRWFFFFLIKQACSLLSVKHELTARAYLCSTTIFHRWWCADTLCLYQNKLQRSDLGLAPDWLFSTTLYTATSCRLFIVMVMGSWPGLIRNTHSHQRQLSVCVWGETVESCSGCSLLTLIKPTAPLTPRQARPEVSSGFACSFFFILISNMT